MKFTLNLATRSYVNRRTLYLSYAALGVLMVVILLFNIMRAYTLNREISRTTDKIKSIEANLIARSGAEAAGFDQVNYRKLLVSIQSANEILQRDSFRWTTLLDQMESVVPRDVRISKIDPNPAERTIKLSGQSKNLKSLKRFIDNLIKSKHYKHVFLDQQSSEPETNIIRFGIHLEGAF